MDIVADAAQLAALEGRQYVVLRPGGAVAEAYAPAREAALALMPAGTPHPAVGHVTLRAFAEPDRVDAVRDAARAWAAAQPPLEVRIAAVDTFPAPFQIVLLRLARTSTLQGAYEDLSARLAHTGLARIGELDPRDWVFHMSLAYGAGLGHDDWEALEAQVAAMRVPTASVTVAEAELVWFEGGEHHEALPLGG